MNRLGRTPREPPCGGRATVAVEPVRRAFAIYAFRDTRTTGPGVRSALPSALAACGIGVLTLDLGSAPPSGPTSAKHNTVGRGR